MHIQWQNRAESQSVTVAGLDRLLAGLKTLRGEILRDTPAPSAFRTCISQRGKKLLLM